MRYELTDNEWSAIKSMLPNKPRGVPRVNDRRVLNGIFWVLRSGAPWRDLPADFGPYTTCYNRFVRWRRAGVWSRIIGAAVEFKFVHAKEEIAGAFSRVAEDTAGYKGSKDWRRFYAVIYQSRALCSRKPLQE